MIKHNSVNAARAERDPLYVYVWFMKQTKSDPFNRDNDISRFRSVMSLPSPSPSSNDLIECFRSTCIYKMDKCNDADRACVEFDNYKLLQDKETIPSPYHVTSFVRRFKLYNTDITATQTSSAMRALMGNNGIRQTGLVMESI